MGFLSRGFYRMFFILARGLKLVKVSECWVYGIIKIMKSPYDLLWAKALRVVSARPISREDLRKKLENEIPNEPGTVLRVLDEMERVQLLSDRRYAEMLVNHLIQKPIGRLKIMIETRRKGLPETLVQSLLIGLGWDEAESAQRALKSKEALIRETDPRKKRQKLVNFLRNRGFNDAVIFRALRGEEE